MIIFLIRNKHKVQVDHVIEASTEYQMLVGNEAHKRPDSSTIQVRWIPPAENSYKLNTNGSACHTIDLEGIGGVFRNQKGEWIWGFKKQLTQMTATHAERQAILHGLQIAKEKGLTPLEINTDSTIGINMI